MIDWGTFCREQVAANFDAVHASLIAARDKAAAKIIEGFFMHNDPFIEQRQEYIHQVIQGGEADDDIEKIRALQTECALLGHKLTFTTFDPAHRCFCFFCGFEEK